MIPCIVRSKKYNNTLENRTLAYKYWQLLQIELLVVNYMRLQQVCLVHQARCCNVWYNRKKTELSSYTLRHLTYHSFTYALIKCLFRNLNITWFSLTNCKDKISLWSCNKVNIWTLNLVWNWFICIQTFFTYEQNKSVSRCICIDDNMINFKDYHENIPWKHTPRRWRKPAIQMK